MKKTGILLVAIFLINVAYSQELTVVKKGKAKSSIIIPDKPAEAESKAAAALQNYIQQMSGAKIEILSDREVSKGPEILIGKVNRPESQAIAIDQLGKNGFILRNVGNKLVITGGADKGILYAVNGLVEKYLGYRRYSSVASVIPKHKSIIFNSIDNTQIPSFAFRRTSCYEANQGDMPDWNHVNNNSNWGAWVHTFNQLLSVKEYGASHPEYFSFYNGTRHTEVNATTSAPLAQLCLSNPEVLEIVCKNLQAMIDKNPAAQIWSVSQNDNVNYCRCPECSKIDAQYAAPGTADLVYITGNTRYAPMGSGSVINFVNKVAARFPDKVISTLAYQYSRRPPVNLIPAKNVNIMLCSIESPRNVPISVGDKPFIEDLAGWGKLTNNILEWDYTIQFRNMVSPFPNFRTFQPNLQSLKNNNVTALYQQGDSRSGGEFAELRAYMITKIMWNSDVNINDVMNDFMNGYYGKAGKIVREYIDIMHNKMEQTNTKLAIFGSPMDAKATHLSDSLVKVYNKIFDRAEKAVRKSPDMLSRVKSARLPLYYAMLEIAKSEKTGPRGAFIVNEKGEQIPNPFIVDILNKFVSHSIATNVNRYTEYAVTPQQYLEAYNDFLAGRPAKPIPRL